MTHTKQTQNNMKYVKSLTPFEAIVNNVFFLRVVNISILYIVGQDSNKHFNRRCHQYLIPNEI